MKNERGMTLIELIASVLVSMIVLAAGSLLVYSLSSQSRQAAQQTIDTSNAKRAMDGISQSFAQAVSANLISSAELRYKTGASIYKALVFVQEAGSSSGSLYTYDFSNDGDTSNDSDDYLDTAITLATDPSKYTNPILLATNVASFPTVQYYDAFSSPAPTASYTPMTTSTGVLSKGEALEFTLTFNFTIAGSKQVQRTYTTALKMIKLY